MASIATSPGTFGKKIESNTRNMEEWMIQFIRELQLLRIGDKTPGQNSVL